MRISPCFSCGFALACVVLLIACGLLGSCTQDRSAGPASSTTAPAAGWDIETENRRVSDIRIEGLKEVSRQQALDQIRLVKGQTFSKETARADIARLSYLARFSMMNVRVEPKDDGSVVVIYTVVEAPIIRNVQVSGNKAIGTQELLDLVALRSGDSVDSYLIKLAKQRIVAAYRDKGYSQCEVAVDQDRLKESGLLLLQVREGRAPASTPTASPAAPPSDQIAFQEETLANGLHVIYAPLHQAPVVHVRVLYHVGSRDERPDRQGFAHMFEHMMFRGSAHVGPQEHMKFVGMVGGNCNAFTSFDQTVYFDTLPANYLETALYLEADRMASFKVSDEIFRIERNVVAEEWRMKQNQPYGNQWEDYLRTAFTRHPYRWTPIGNMDHLRAAGASDLQAFFNKYYVPNNAVMVIAGDIDVPAAKRLVQKYLAWVPRGADVQRDIPVEPPQTQPRRLEVKYRVPLARVLIGYPMPAHRSDDHEALSVLASILSEGRSSRLERLLVNTEKPLCVDVGSFDWNLEDGGVFSVGGRVLAGRDSAEVEKALTSAVADVVAHGVTTEELEKAKTLTRVELIRSRETADSLASQLGAAELFDGDAGRVNKELALLNAVTVKDVQAVAAKYLKPEYSTTLLITPDLTVTPATIAPLTTVAPSTQFVAPRPVAFPSNYPATPPVAAAGANPTFAKGVESDANGVRFIVMPDSRLPLVNWSLTMRAGSHSDPQDKAGLAGLTAAMVRRGSQGLTFARINEILEARGISIEVGDGGDYTRLSGSCTTDQLDYAIAISQRILRSPTFPADEFARLKEQMVNQLRLAQANAATVAGDELRAALYGDSPLGVHATPASVAAITLDDVKDCYRRLYRPNDAVLIVSGDIAPGSFNAALVEQLVEGWGQGDLPAAVYRPAAAPAKLRIILVDRPEGQQSTVRIGIPAYDIHNEDKYAGALANQILSGDLDSRLPMYVRAEKGLAYSVWGVFQPGRHGGLFLAATDSKIPSTADAIEGIFKVLDDTRGGGVTEAELANAKLRVAGGMVMGMQTIQQQAGYRVDGILNGYPVDYFDQYPARVAQVTREQVRAVLARYMDPDKATIIVVAPAAQVQAQLEKLGEVQVIPMPGRPAATPAQGQPK